MKKNKINVDLLLKNERSTIDRLDAIIINALIERFSVTKRIGLIKAENNIEPHDRDCLLYTSPSPRDTDLSRMPSSA